MGRGDRGSRRDRAMRRAAYAVAGVGAASCVATVPAHAVLSRQVELSELFWSDLVVGTVWPLLGAAVARVQPRNRLVWPMLAPALIGPYHLLAYYAGYSRLVAEHPLPGWQFGAWLGCWGFVGYYFATPLVPLLFPYGRLGTRPRRILAWTVIAVATTGTLAAMLRPSATDPVPGLANPLGVQGWEWLHIVMYATSATCMAAGTAAAGLFVVLRTRAAHGVERSQLQWLMLGGLLMTLAFTAVGFTAGQRLLTDLLMVAGLLGPPAGIAVAMLRHRLYDVEVVLGRAIVFTLLSGLVLGVYLAVVAGVGTLAPGSLGGTAAIAAAALLAAAGRGAVQSAVDRLLFGHRHDPYAVMARVGRHLAPASEPAEAMRLLVDELRRALRLPYAAFTGPAMTATSGTPVPGAGWRTVPCLALGRRVGELHLGRRRAAEPWTAQQRGAAEEVAARAATLAYAAALVEDVARSRAHIVAVREEERRRLRADLHDGVGPSLAGTAHQLDSLARKATDPELADAIRVARDRLRTTVGDLRTVVNGLRPAVLDQLGLSGALRELLAGYDVPTCRCSVTAACSELPASVEVAAYAIAAEAVSNALKHSASGRLTLTAHVTAGFLVLTIEDNGCGIPPRPRAGVGLRSMSERAAEVGGRLAITPVPGGGTSVQARMPLPLEETCATA
ncbi:histidine kinase [Streptomyces sp. NBC_01604]|uniref:sensor histidine kinase n=1 Tax=Streptomyces sp. NBC_01604 TaxID=2975894 RepID=UPI0038704611